MRTGRESARARLHPCRTYDFSVKHIEDGQEISYKGPYGLCCEFFDNSNCTWVGEYPNNTQVGGCPVPRGPWSASIKRPLWIRLPGTFRARLSAYSETGTLLESVETFAAFQDPPEGAAASAAPGEDAAGAPSTGLALFPSDENKNEGESAGARERAARRARQQEGPGAGKETTKVNGYGVRGDDADARGAGTLSAFTDLARDQGEEGGGQQGRGEREREREGKREQGRGEGGEGETGKERGGERGRSGEGKGEEGEGEKERQ